jgi:hypothetical protein
MRGLVALDEDGVVASALIAVGVAVTSATTRCLLLLLLAIAAVAEALALSEAVVVSAALALLVRAVTPAAILRPNVSVLVAAFVIKGAVEFALLKDTLLVVPVLSLPLRALFSE